MISIEDGGGSVRKYLKAALFECGENGEMMVFCISGRFLRFAVPISPEDAISIADDISAKARSIIKEEASA